MLGLRVEYSDLYCLWLSLCMYLLVFSFVSVSVWLSKRWFSSRLYSTSASSGNQVDGLPLVWHNTGVVIMHWQRKQQLLVKKHTLKCIFIGINKLSEPKFKKCCESVKSYIQKSNKWGKKNLFGRCSITRRCFWKCVIFWEKKNI